MCVWLGNAPHPWASSYLARELLASIFLFQVLWTLPWELPLDQELRKE